MNLRNDFERWAKHLYHDIPTMDVSLWFVFKLLLSSLFLQLSILVHPDKNQDDPDRAQKAFEGARVCFHLQEMSLVIRAVQVWIPVCILRCSSCGQSVQTLTGTRAEEESFRCHSSRKGIRGTYGEWLTSPFPEEPFRHVVSSFDLYWNVAFPAHVC